MKQLTTKFLSVILILSIVFTSSIPALAVESYNDEKTSTNTQVDIDIVRETYATLSPEAKAIFDKSLAYDPEMLKFHTTYVDQNFTPPVITPKTRRAVAATDPMRILTDELNKLKLPPKVIYPLKAMGASMVAAVADGPLPVGDIMLAATTASVVVIIAANWSTVAPMFDGITRAFQKAFSTATSNISLAFAKIKSDAKKEADKNEKKEAEKKEKKEVEDAKKEIPSRLKDKNGRVKMGEFNRKIKGKTGYKEKGGWSIEKDRDGHKGSEWKLKNEKGQRKASLKGNGEVVGK